ncbi:Hypothetical protein A7982_05782 [Minicystis rosea]|nr:Hypothetical protein A7982_05782 [Minicystis rosea]
MAERSIFLYEVREGADWLGSLERDLGRAGLHLKPPGSDLVTPYDDEGERLSMSEEELRRWVDAGHDARFSFWFAADHDVYCRIRESDGVTVIALGMDGCSRAEMESLRAAMEHRFLSRRTTSAGFVFDPDGVTEDYDWDRFFLAKERLDLSVENLPEALGVTRAELGRLVAVPAAAEVVDDGALVVIRAAR